MSARANDEGAGHQSQWRVDAPRTSSSRAGSSLGRHQTDDVSDVLLSVIVPVDNEQATIDRLIAAVLDAPYRKQIIVVDDASTDGSARLLRKWQATGQIELLSHPCNQGKGAAIRTGLARAVHGDSRRGSRVRSAGLSACDSTIARGARRGGLRFAPLGVQALMAAVVQPVLSRRDRIEPVRKGLVPSADHRRGDLLQGISDRPAARDGARVSAVRVLPGSDCQGMPHGVGDRRGTDPLREPHGA